MRIRILGGFRVEHDGRPVEIDGSRQRALLYRLALDPGDAVGYRALAEDLWDHPPENPRASLQTLVSRLRTRLPEGVLESVPDGYRLMVARADVDVVRLQDLVARARRSGGVDALDAARAALELEGAPWTPGDGYDWLLRAVAADRAEAEGLVAASVPRGASDAPTGSAPPAPITALVGRERELAEAGEQLASSRLVTLLGPGGAGKTRLALEISGARPAVFAALAPVGPDEVLQAVVAAVGRELRTAGELVSPRRSATDAVVDALAGREVLLVLDNCEHVVAEAADAAATLLRLLPRVQILATSREPLGLPGEAFVAVGPLEDGAADALLAERIRQARGTAPGPAETGAAARIRARLDGLPLALELAAAKARTLALDEIADGLDDRFALLGRGPRGAEPRQRTLRAVVDWSWRLLDEPERDALTVLAAYPAGIAVGETASACTAHGLDPNAFDALVDRSLLIRRGGRYRALETIREFGFERLAESGSRATVLDVQRRRLTEAAEAADRELRSAACLPALAWFDGEDDNLLAACRSAEREDPDALAGLVAACLWYWVLRDRNGDAATWVRIAAPTALGDGEADVLVRLFESFVLQFDEESASGDPDPARLRAVEAEFAGRPAPRHDLLQVFPTLARIAFAALSGAPVDLELPEGEGRSPWAEAALRVLLAALAQNRGAPALLGDLSADALARFERIGDLWGLAVARQMRAEWLVLDGRFDEALGLSDAAADDMRRVTSMSDLLAQQGLGVRLLLALGRVDEARARAAALGEEARRTESSAAIAQAAITSATLHLALDEIDAARADLDAGDAALAELPARAAQLRAAARVAHALVLRESDPDAAWAHLRAAADLVVPTRDHPVMAAVAVAIGTVAAGQGDLDTAARTLATARALRGAADPSDPLEVALARRVGAGADAAPALDRAEAADELVQILRR